jgi:hypothetical protein
MEIIATRLGKAKKGYAPSVSTKQLDPNKFPPNIIFVDNVDVTKLNEPGYLDIIGGGKFDDIVFNAPRGTTGDRWRRATAELINNVLASSRNVLNPGGNVRFSSSRGMPGGQHLLELMDSVVPGYSTSRRFPFLSDEIFGLRNYQPTDIWGKPLKTKLEDIYWFVFKSLK